MERATFTGVSEVRIRVPDAALKALFRPGDEVELAWRTEPESAGRTLRVEQTGSRLLVREEEGAPQGPERPQLRIELELPSSARLAFEAAAASVLLNGRLLADTSAALGSGSIVYDAAIVDGAHSGSVREAGSVTVRARPGSGLRFEARSGTGPISWPGGTSFGTASGAIGTGDARLLLDVGTGPVTIAEGDQPG